MNWQEIKEKYPKGYKLAQMWWIDEAELSQFEDFNPCSGVNVNDRYLYDFFDEQGIYVEVYVVGISERFKVTDWTYDIANESIENDDYSTRTEAEEQAFLKAFEILENKL